MNYLLVYYYNVIKSHDLSNNGFYLIETISYLPKIDLLLIIYHLTYLTFLINFINQPFNQSTQLTFSINL